jgi:hypothetical protein
VTANKSTGSRDAAIIKEIVNITKFMNAIY